MTILRQINPAAMSHKLSNLEACADAAPDGSYDTAKAVCALVSDTADDLMTALNELGLAADGCDAARTLEACIYHYIVESNPRAGDLVAGEGFGQALNGPAAERIVAQAQRDVDFLRDRLPR